MFVVTSSDILINTDTITHVFDRDDKGHEIHFVGGETLLINHSDYIELERLVGYRSL